MNCDPWVSPNQLFAEGVKVNFTVTQQRGPILCSDLPSCQYSARIRCPCEMVCNSRQSFKVTCSINVPSVQITFIQLLTRHCCCNSYDMSEPPNHRKNSFMSWMADMPDQYLAEVHSSKKICLCPPCSTRVTINLSILRS